MALIDFKKIIYELSDESFLDLKKKTSPYITFYFANVDAAAAGETGRQVAVSGAVTLAGNATSITSQADTSALYTIQVNYDGPGGLVKTIKVTKTSN